MTFGAGSVEIETILEAEIGQLEDDQEQDQDQEVPEILVVDQRVHGEREHRDSRKYPESWRTNSSNR